MSWFSDLFNKKYSADELSPNEKPETNTETLIPEVKEPKKLDISEPCYAIVKSLKKRPESWIIKDYKHDVTHYRYDQTIDIYDSLLDVSFKATLRNSSYSGYHYFITVDHYSIFTRYEKKMLVEAFFKFQEDTYESRKNEFRSNLMEKYCDK